MAGSRIKGITVEIGGDTTKLQTALKGVNSEIKNTQSQLKDVEKLLKLDPGNTELLAQKQKLLSSAVSETKEKLATLKTAAEQANQALADADLRGRDAVAKARILQALKHILNIRAQLLQLPPGDGGADLVQSRVAQQQYFAFHFRSPLTFAQCHRSTGSMVHILYSCFPLLSSSPRRSLSFYSKKI